MQNMNGNMRAIWKCNGMLMAWTVAESTTFYLQDKRGNNLKQLLITRVTRLGYPVRFCAIKMEENTHYGLKNQSEI